jgi:2-dehydro-3-deoxyphosphogluconate aldolase/(4S)-4-hydroxy-2-oxoglutarate aldolase
MTVDELMAIQPVIPVVTVEDVADAEPIATALVKAGLRVIELVMRTASAPEAIKRMAGVKDAIVGAGTVLSAKDLETAVASGARFIVTPGLSAPTVAAARAKNVPILPGVATPTEIMAGLELGLNRFKFFPAEQAGGLAMLTALAGPFGAVKFCPTGGITLDLARDYLARPNVAVVGGGWLTPKKLVDVHAWDQICEMARLAARLERR